jgi:hypothetical protein
MIKAEYAKVIIEGKNMVDAVSVDKSKAGAVGETQALRIVFAEYGARGLFRFFRDSQYSDAKPFEILQERYGGEMAASRADESIGLVKNKIGSKLHAGMSKHLFQNGFGGVVMRIFRDCQSTKNACIVKQFHAGSSPYKYLSWLMETSVSPAPPGAIPMIPAKSANDDAFDVFSPCRRVARNVAKSSNSRFWVGVRLDTCSASFVSSKAVRCDAMCNLLSCQDEIKLSQNM